MKILSLNFVSIKNFEATYLTKNGAQTLLCETRTDADGKQIFYTVLDGREIRAKSLHHFIVESPDCISISIRHRIWVMWNGDQKPAELLEVLTKNDADSVPINTKLSLIEDGRIFTTEECDTLSQAVKELHDVVGPSVTWRLKTCHHCIYAWPAFPYVVSDRDELRCYRDAPEEMLTEVLQKRKFASVDALHSGHYFVDAFHTCAAWRSFGESVS